jgi:phosphatidylglycerophosphatase C
MLFRSLPDLFAFKILKSIDNGEAKQRVLQRCIGGHDVEVLTNKAVLFAQTELPKHLKPDAFKKLSWHLSEGHQVGICSASVELYLKPFAARWGFSENVCGSVLEIQEGKFTGRLIGNNCWGQEKYQRLVTHFGSLENYTFYAYGDTRGDKEMLEAADFPFFRKYD